MSKKRKVRRNDGENLRGTNKSRKGIRSQGGNVPDRRSEQAVIIPPRRVAHHKEGEIYEELKINLLARHPRGDLKAILFVGTNHGVGSSTTAVNFATALAKDCRNRVLLMDVNLRTPSLHDVFHLEPDCGLSDIPTNEEHPEQSLKKVNHGDLFVMTCGGSDAGPINLFESASFCRFLKLMRAQFDYVILDGPPTPSFSETRVLCSKVDGVILVLHAGKTRRQVALRAKQVIEEAGGRVLGVVLNRRKFYIPAWIYKRL